MKKIVVILLLIISWLYAKDGDDKMNQETRISRSAKIQINHPIDKVFPLFGAVEEKKWADGWDLEIVYSKDPLLEKNMVFTTESYDEDEEYLTWIVSEYLPEEKIIKYTIFGVERVWTIDIKCIGKEEKTAATVTYTFTGITENGCAKNKNMLERIYKYDLQDWGKMIDHYLETGEALKHDH